MNSNKLAAMTAIGWFLVMLIGFNVPAMSADTLCDPSLSTTGGNWLVRWGQWSDAQQEPPYHITCQGSASGNAQAARITTSTTLNAVVLEWFKNTPYSVLRRSEITFMVPAASFSGWNHIADFPAYRRPISGESTPNVDQLGRIGADIFHDAGNTGRIVIQFNKYTDNVDSAGQPAGCDGTANNTFGWTPIPAGLQPDHWYRLSAQITQRADKGLDVIGTLQDFQQPDLPILAQTSYSAPATCTPGWYSGTENRWAVGVMDTDPVGSVDVYLDDFVGWPEQTPPTISAVSASNITSASAKINWSTHEPATSQVEYGPTTGYGSLTPVDANLVSSHAVTVSGLAASTMVHYRVRSKDAVGNESIGVDGTFTTGVVDSTQPIVSITNPPDGSSRRRKTTISVTADASDNVGVSKVEFYLNGALQITDTTSPYSWKWYTGVSTGQATLSAKAYDARGNIGTSAAVKVTITQ